MEIDVENTNVLINTELERIFTIFKQVTDDRPTEFAKDMDKLNHILSSSNYDYISKEYWDIFKQKYQIANTIDKLIGDYSEAMRLVYIHCMIPFNLKLDIKYGTDVQFKESVELSAHRTLHIIRRFISNTWISILSILIIIFALYFSWDFSERGSVWASNLFLGIAASVSAAMILAKINHYLGAKEKRLSSQKQRIEKSTEYLVKVVDEGIQDFLRVYNKRNTEYLFKFCEINNDVHDYLKRIQIVKGIYSVEDVLALKKFEKEIFEFSSAIVRRNVDVMHSKISKEEKAKLKYYLFELSMHLEYLQNGIVEFIYGLERNIKKINKNKIN